MCKVLILIQLQNFGTWFWDLSLAAVSENAHEITDAVASKFVSCLLRAFKRFKNVWPALSSTQARNMHVCVRLSQSDDSWFRKPWAFISDADCPTSNFSKVDFKQNFAFMMMVTDLTETFLGSGMAFLWPDREIPGIRALPFRCCHRHWSKFEVAIIGAYFKYLNQNQISFYQL